MGVSEVDETDLVESVTTGTETQSRKTRQYQRWVCAGLRAITLKWYKYYEQCYSKYTPIHVHQLTVLSYKKKEGDRPFNSERNGDYYRLV